MPFLPARIEGDELVVVTKECDLRLKEYFDPEWNLVKRFINWIRRLLNASY
jgi:hypothetical protein